MTKHHILISGAALLAIVTGVRDAGAGHHPDDAAALIVDATLIKPLGEEGRVGESVGAGGELRFLPDDEIATISIGGYGAIGRPSRDKTLRDIYDLHFNAGLKWERSHGRILIPYATLGLDVLYMTTHEQGADGAAARTLRGSTLGVNAQLGVLGHLGDGFVYRVSATYLGAVVPGTGDDLGGLVLQLGVGKTMGD